MSVTTTDSWYWLALLGVPWIPTATFWLVQREAVPDPPGGAVGIVSDPVRGWAAVVADADRFGCEPPPQPANPAPNPAASTTPKGFFTESPLT